MGKVLKNKGALTVGPEIDKTTGDDASKKLIQELAIEIKNETFRFKPIRRIYIDKTGKNKNLNEEIEKLYKSNKVTPQAIKQLRARPLGIPSLRDKIVQEAIRLILNSIYEPEFAKINLNYGFRANLGCQDAINHIQKKVKAMTYAIEGDIEGAFDNVDFKILIETLKEKISDDKFLRLILNGLKSGSIYKNFRESANIGTTQGSILSPLLFNIYFHKFDKFISEELTNKIAEKNKIESRKERPAHKLYNSISKRKSQLKLKEKIDNLKQTYSEIGKESPEFIKAYSDFKKATTQHKLLTKDQMKYPAFSKRRQIIRFNYIRYADDWIIFTNGTKEFTEEIKNQITETINEKLKLKVSPEKTKITNLNKDSVKFLGYQLTNANKSKKKIVKISAKRKGYLSPVLRRKKFTYTKSNYNKLFTQRATNPTLIVAWDRKRVTSRLEEKRFIRKKVFSKDRMAKSNWIGCSKKEWTCLEIPEIIERYNYVIRGYILYYAPVTTYPTDIHQLFYLLKYSCAHTLAQKLNTKISNIFNKYTKDIKIKYTQKINKKNKKGEITNSEVDKQISLLTWENCINIIAQAIQRFRKRTNQTDKSETEQIIKKSVDEICDIKVNWRTKYKLSKHCAICGSEDKVEYHHVKHIKKGKIEGFLQILKQLNRKQIPCCKECHTKIHQGKYDDISLSDLYDEELVII